MSTRALAAQIIYQVIFAQTSLTEAFEQTKIPDKDRGFVKEICFGTIRYWITLQAILKNLLEKPLKKEDKDIECLLCVGLYQILYMDTADYAAVNETVSATRVFKKAWAAGLVNKILRMVIMLPPLKKGVDAWNASGDLTKSITAKYAHPNWIIEKLQKAYPHSWEEILEANNRKAPLFLRVNQRLISRDNFIKLIKIDHEIFDDLPNCVLIKNPTSVENIPGFYEGYFSVQDASGQRVIDYLDLQSGQIVLDACAAPGSKTTHILETMPSLKKLVAVDLYENRLKKVKENIKRLKLNSANVDCVAADICDPTSWWKGKKFDRILLDAPCSASGVIRRHPDIKLLRKKTDIPELAKTQLRMLETLWPLLKENGKLIYTTCSVFPEENHEVVQKFLGTHSDAKVALETQLLPKTGDGFYYSILHKL